MAYLGLRLWYCRTLGTASLSCLSSNIQIDISGNSSSISSSSQASVELAVLYTARVIRVCDVVRGRRLLIMLIYASNYTVFFSLSLQIKGGGPTKQYTEIQCCYSFRLNLKKKSARKSNGSCHLGSVWVCHCVLSQFAVAMAMILWPGVCIMVFVIRPTDAANSLIEQSRDKD